jgi:LacI family transcriptional regulator
MAGVSTAVVSRIVNQDPTLRVRATTREAVESAIAMLDYTPHSSARALRKAQTGLLGFALHSVNDHIYAEMVDEAQAEAARRNYSLILMNIGELADRREAFREIVLGHRVDGLLIHGGHGVDESGLRELARGLPSVMFNTDPGAGLRTIRFDDAIASGLATQHLIDLGHEAIMYIGDTGSTSQRRYEGYRTAMTQAGLPSYPLVASGLSPDESHDATVHLLRSGIPVTALVVVSTTQALGVHSGIVAAGRRIPEDISLISVHDVWFARHLNPPLSAVSLPVGHLGAVAVSVLIDQITTPSEGDTVVTDPAPQVLSRRSTAPPRR